MHVYFSRVCVREGVSEYERGCIVLHVVISSCFKYLASFIISMNSVTDWHYIKSVRNTASINIWANNLVTHYMASRYCVIIGYDRSFQRLQCNVDLALKYPMNDIQGNSTQSLCFSFDIFYGIILGVVTQTRCEQLCYGIRTHFNWPRKVVWLTVRVGGPTGQFDSLFKINIPPFHRPVWYKFKRYLNI